MVNSINSFSSWVRTWDKERKKETEHQHNEFKKVNVNAHAALCCSLCELSHHIYDMEKRGEKDKNDNQNVRPVSLFPPSLLCLS